MKKTLLLSIAGLFAANVTFAQSVIYDNGPLFDLPGGGANGYNASTLHDGMTTYGAGHAVSSGYRVADDIVIPAGQTWTIDSLVFYGYQTGSGPNSSINNVNVRIWDGQPGSGGTIIWGDSLTNTLITTEFSGTYRTNSVGAASCPAATCVDRPVMRNATFIGTTLTSGTYWLDWQSGGTLTSGPWAPPINLGLGNTTTGNALQFNVDPASPNYFTWVAHGDGGTLTPQGFPFLVVGSIFTGIQEVGNTAQVAIFPNPVHDKATVSVRANAKAGDKVAFNVYDILGNRVKSQVIEGEKDFSFVRGSLTNGVYVYEVTINGKSVKNGKLILQ